MDLHNFRWRVWHIVVDSLMIAIAVDFICLWIYFAINDYRELILMTQNDDKLMAWNCIDCTPVWMFISWFHFWVLFYEVIGAYAIFFRFDSDIFITHRNANAVVKNDSCSLKLFSHSFYRSLLIISCHTFNEHYGNCNLYFPTWKMVIWYKWELEMQEIV